MGGCNDGTPAVQSNVSGVSQTTSIQETTVVETTIKNTTTSTSKTIPTVALTAEEQLLQTLKSKYRILTTDMGTTEFTFALARNKDKKNSFDYVLQVEYDSLFFSDIFNSIDYTESQCKELKNSAIQHMKKIANECISALPNKKILGCYYADGYHYPNLHLDHYNVNHCVWCNYTYGNLGADNTPYSETKLSSLSGFAWEMFKDIDDPDFDLSPDPNYIDVLLLPADNEFAYEETWK